MDKAEGSGPGSTITKLRALRAIVLEHAVESAAPEYEDVLDLIDEFFPELTR